MNALVVVGIWTAALGCGVMAGVYFAFSAFVMKALRALPWHEASEAMRSINLVIIHSAFLPLFVATTALSLGLIAYGSIHMEKFSGLLLMAGGGIYITAMFLVTMLFNVPMNDALESATAPAAREVWMNYYRDWTRWNHVRTVASLAASVLFTAAAVIARS